MAQGTKVGNYIVGEFHRTHQHYLPRTFVATSTDGFAFTTLPGIVGHFYLRVFQNKADRLLYGLSKPPYLHVQKEAPVVDEFEVDENKTLLNCKSRHLAFLYR